YEDVGKLKAKGDIGVFVGYLKEFATFRIYNKRTRESSSSSLNDDVQQSPEEVILPQTNTQSIPINMIPNGDETSTSHHVFNERWEDAYFDASTSFHDPSNANPNEHHVSAIKRIFRYLKGTINLGLWYLKDSGFDLTTYSDADHAGCHLDRESTSNIVQFLGDKLVCWSSKKQNCVSISTAESEYVVVSSCCAQVLWMRTQLTDYGFFYDKVPFYCDSKSAIAISCNPVHETRTKHIDVMYHFIKDHVEKGTI
nr:uncharacterized mitochondrial protein AtMg00810-like [Tanacetum cinerariifolium]